jgi:hypothetical protein
MDPYLYMIMILIEVCADAGGMGFQLSGTIAGGVTGHATVRKQSTCHEEVIRVNDRNGLLVY